VALVGNALACPICKTVSAAAIGPNGHGAHSLSESHWKQLQRSMPGSGLQFFKCVVR
jgi:hypothetical protein